MPFNKGDFTQQGIAGHVNSILRLNEKRYVGIDLTSNEEAEGCTIAGTVKDLLNDKVYGIGAGVSGNIEITENGENINVAPYATATVNVAGGGGGFPTCEITLVPQAGGSLYNGFDSAGGNYCLDDNGILLASIPSYETNLTVHAFYSLFGADYLIAYHSQVGYLTEADAIASVTNISNLTVGAVEYSGSYYVMLTVIDPTLPSACTMTGDGK